MPTTCTILHFLLLHNMAKTKMSRVIFCDDETKLPTLPEPCLTHYFMSSTLHYERIELCISQFKLKDHYFIQCRSESWPCCDNSDLGSVADHIHALYSRRFGIGQWVDHGYVDEPLQAPASIPLTPSLETSVIVRLRKGPIAVNKTDEWFRSWWERL